MEIVQKKHTNIKTHIRDTNEPPEAGPTGFIKQGHVVCQHTCSFWANAVGLVSARSGSRYCRGSSHSDSLSNRGLGRAGAGASTGPWLRGYRATGRSGQRAWRRAGVSMAKQALSV